MRSYKKTNKFKHLFDDVDYFETAQNTHTKSMDKYLEKYDFDKDNIHIIEGLEPEEIIPDIASVVGVDLLVMGSVGRDGFEAALVGNTAEKILDELECDVLVLKPEKLT